MFSHFYGIFTMNILILLNILLVVDVHSAIQRVDPLVLISQGLVRGQRATDGDYSAFLGIPYATVDIDNPFGDAQAAPNFEEEIYHAYDNSITCPQNSITSESQSIDCLQLSIYVPSQASSSNPLPVLVWTHGGFFKEGSANIYGARNLVRHGVIVVTINYRLGPYGFMCLDNPSVPGNQGLKDQYAALRWVRQNIAAFGGNPYNVTLGGQSAGAASVLLQLYSTNEKLFHKIIAESGTPFSPHLFTVDGDCDAAVKLANYLGLNTTDDEQALKFLTKSHHSLVTGASDDLNLQFKPCKEKSFSGIHNFIDSEPYAFSNVKKLKATPILIGHTNSEYILQREYESDIFYEEIQNIFNLDEEQLDKAAEVVRHFYIGDKSIPGDVNTEAASFYSDFVFNHPIQDTIKSLIEQNAGPVYEYVFTYVGDSGAAAAGHSAELPYLFNIASQSEAFSTEDLLLIDQITTLWTNFIKYGNPTTESSDLIPLTWAPVTENTRPYMNIGSELNMEDRFQKERMAFWDLFYSVYGKNNKLAHSCDHM